MLPSPSQEQTPSEPEDLNQDPDQTPESSSPEQAPSEPQAPEAESPEEPAPEGEEPAEPGETDKPEEPAQAAPKPEVERQKRGGYQRKIERLERDRQILLEQLQRAGVQPQGATQQQPPKEKTPAEQAQDYVNGLVEKRLAEREAQREQQAREQAFQKRMSEARNTHEDFEEVVLAASHVPVSQALGQALLTSEAPGEIMYQLAKNPAELARISALPPLDAAREIGRLEAKSVSGAVPPKPKPAIRPPVPPSRVGASAATSTRRLEDLPLAEYKRAMRRR